MHMALEEIHQQEIAIKILILNVVFLLTIVIQDGGALEIAKVIQDDVEVEVAAVIQDGM